jgi:hypothetical protein
MKMYLAATTAIFGLLTIVHIWRAVVEPSAVNPWFIATTVLSVLLCIWSARLYMNARRREAPPDSQLR